MTVHNHPPYRPMCPERVVNGHLRGACMGSDHETIRDQAAIRASWDGDCPDVTRIVRRVGAALNSGRDAAVVEVVLDETQAARDEADTLRTQLAAILGEHWTVYETRDGKVWTCYPPTRENALKEAELAGPGHEAIPLHWAQAMANAWCHGRMAGIEAMRREMTP